MIYLFSVYTLQTSLKGVIDCPLEGTIGVSVIYFL